MEREQLIKHYIEAHKDKIFATEIKLSSCNYCIMYKYNYKYELEYFKNEFLCYFPYYIRNEDLLKNIDLSAEIENQLKKVSVKIYKKSLLVPKREKEVNGIYGELFLDFYLQIVKKRNPFITYAEKRGYGSNAENKGIDNVVYYFDGNDLNICFCESKFVSDKNSALNSLCADIKGNKKSNGHLNSEFINKYMHFIIEKDPKIYEDKKQKMKLFLDELNKELYSEKKFLDILKDKNICINFIFFAIFQNNIRDIKNLENQYNEIKRLAKYQIKEMQITNFKIEIIFIPTDNKSLVIKEEIDKNYE